MGMASTVAARSVAMEPLRAGRRRMKRHPSRLARRPTDVVPSAGRMLGSLATPYRASVMAAASTA